MFGYWLLGKRYKEFESLNVKGIEASHERHKTRKVFELLLGNPAIADLYTSKREHEALRKRLERARKFVLLTECFSISILLAVPTISVSNIDRYKLRELLMLAKGPTDNLINDETYSRTVSMLKSFEHEMKNTLQSLL